MSELKVKKTSVPLLYFIKPYPVLISGVVFLILISSFLEGFNILLIYGIFNTVLRIGQPVADFNPDKFTKVIAGLLDVFPFENKLISAFFILFLVIVLKCIIDFLRRYFTCYASCKVWYDVQHRIFSRCLYADYSFFVDNKEGEIVYRCFTAPVTLGVTLQYICEFLAEIVKLLIIFFALFTISLNFSLLIIVFAGSFYLIINLVSKKVSYFIGKGRQEASIKQTVILTELINGIKQIRIFLSEKKWLNEYDKAMKRYFGLYIKDETIQALPANMLEILAMGVLGILFLFSGKGKGGLNAGSISMIGVYIYSLYRFLPSLKNISAKRMGYVGNLAVIENLYDFCKQNINTIIDGKVSLAKFSKEIEFINVGFSYSQNKEVLKGMSLRIKKGQTIALVGKSGSGKTTIVNLMLRLFLPVKGSILVDGINLEDLKIDTWLNKIGYVSQEAFIFNGTVRDNIIFGRSADEDRMIEVCKLANAYDFILESTDGFDTLVGDKGVKLSGGQRQRIAIARAMYNDPDILIFDEATSSLDNLSELMIQNALKKISLNHTVILVAHRLSTVINSDRIIVLDSGRIIEQGTHNELINNGKEYWRLYNKEALMQS